MFTSLTVQPCGALHGSARFPGDKSISHRGVMLAAIASGVSRLDGFLFGADNLATIDAMRSLGVAIEMNQPHLQVTIHGVGKHGLQTPQALLDVGNSGTAMRLMMGLLAGQSFTSTLTGDESLNQRPMQRVADPLQLMGASLGLTANGTAPVEINGVKELAGIEYLLPMASAQVKSALLLAGLYATGQTTVIEPAVTRDHTERMLRAFGYPVNTMQNQISLTGGGELQATDLKVPADISSAAFFMVAASIIPGSKVTLTEVGINPTRIGVIDILRSMGANINLTNQTSFGEEPVADIAIESASLKAIDIHKEQVALAIDEMPVVMIAAACASGTTRIRGARELRVKETDRIAAMAEGLSQLGIQCKVYDDGIDIEGGHLSGGRVQSFGDHRIAMSFAIAAARASHAVTIADCENIATSFPSFTEVATKLGMKLQGS